MKKWPMVVALTAVLAACAPSGTSAPPAGSPAASADWSAPTICTLGATETGIESTPLRFVKGKASILRIWNNSQSRYSFAAPEFFAAIAPWKLVHKGRSQNLPIVCGLGGTVVQRVPGSISETSLTSGPMIRSIDVEPGEVSDLYFVPLKEGRYSFECTLVAEATCTTATMISVVAE